MSLFTSWQRRQVKRREGLGRAGFESSQAVFLGQSTFGLKFLRRAREASEIDREQKVLKGIRRSLLSSSLGKSLL